jgi:hypothetical protein
MFTNKEDFFQKVFTSSKDLSIQDKFIEFLVKNMKNYEL